MLSARQGIAVGGQDEAYNSSNKGNYTEILELVIYTHPSLFN